MKFTIEQLLNLNQALQQLFQRELPAKLQYYVARNLAKIGDELKTFDETRYSLGEKYGELNDDKTRFVFPDDDVGEKFEGEFKELIASEVELPLTKLKLEWLEELEISGPQMLALLEIIEE